jgi:hypothetical protein
MTYIKLPRPQKTLFVALTLVGVSSLPLASSDPIAQAHSAIPKVSTATSTQLPTSQLLMPGQATAKSLLNNSNILVQQPKRYPTGQLAQTQGEPPNPGDNRTPLGGGTVFGQEEPPNRGDNPTGSGGGTFARAPGQRQGKPEVRGECPSLPQGIEPLTALVPEAAINDLKVVLGKTVAEHPTFWFYVPYSLTSSQSVEFVLQDENDNIIYKTSLTGSGNSPGVVGFQLPSTVPPLAVGKSYRWFFVFNCNPTDDEQSFHVDGWVQRVALNPSLKSQLEQATLREKVALYAKAGSWYERLTALAELRRQNSGDATLRKQWTELLESIGLNTLAQAPITSVLTPSELVTEEGQGASTNR